jgi:hypothetical protein
MKQIIEQLKDSIPSKGLIYDRMSGAKLQYNCIEDLIIHVDLMFNQYNHLNHRRINICEDLVVFKIGVLTIGYIIREK